MTKKTIMNALKTSFSQVTLIVLSFLFATIFLLVSGYDPFAILKGMYNSFTSDIAGTIRWATPLILSGLAIAVTYKAKVFNLGVDGQIYMGAAAASYVGLLIPSTIPTPLALIVVFIAGMIAGMLYALIPALLKIYLRMNEVVTTLLLNFVAILFIEFLVTGPMRDITAGTNLNASAVFPVNTWLPKIGFFDPSLASVGFYIALIMVAVIAVLFFKTTLGYEIKVVGSNPNYAKYSGMQANKTIIKVMLISGAIAGMVGVIEVTAIQHRLLAGFNPEFGFDGIVVSLLANNNPIGVVFTGFFFGALKNGGINMQRITDVPSAVTEIVMAVIIIVIAAKFAMPKVKKFFRTKRALPEPDISDGGVS